MYYCGNIESLQRRVHKFDCKSLGDIFDSFAYIGAQPLYNKNKIAYQVNNKIVTFESHIIYKFSSFGK